MDIQQSDRENTPLGDPGQGVGRGNWTPGPWITDSFFCDGDHALRIAMPNVRTMPGATIAMAEHNWHDAERGERRISWKEATANARLIAAAPDLLEALEELVGEDLCGDVNPDNATRETEFYRPVISWAMRHRARTAIAKARGE